MKTEKRIIRVIACILALTSTMAIASVASAEDTNAPLSVYVVNYPLQYFAERIGGPDVRVTFPAPSDGDPAFWKPSAEQVSFYQKADLILLNGASYAKWISHVSLPASRVADTSLSFEDKFIPLEDQGTHSHGLEGKHEHGDVAFTTWLDPLQAISQAQAIRDALIRLRPQAADEFNRRFNSLENDLKELDESISDLVKAGPSQPLVFSHPVYQYFIRRYSLKGKEVHWEPEESPTKQQRENLKQILKDHPSKWLVWEGEPNPTTVADLKNIGLDSLTFDPCGNVPESGDYLSVMRKNVDSLKKAF